MRACAKCGTSENIAEHHKIPKKGWNGTDYTRVLLCKKCHDRLHFELLVWFGSYLKIHDERLWYEMRQHFIEHIAWWLNEGK